MGNKSPFADWIIFWIRFFFFLSIILRKANEGDLSFYCPISSRKLAPIEKRPMPDKLDITLMNISAYSLSQIRHNQCHVIFKLEATRPIKTRNVWNGKAAIDT